MNHQSLIIAIYTLLFNSFTKQLESVFHCIKKILSLIQANIKRVFCLLRFYFYICKVKFEQMITVNKLLNFLNVIFTNNH